MPGELAADDGLLDHGAVLHQDDLVGVEQLARHTRDHGARVDLPEALVPPQRLNRNGTECGCFSTCVVSTTEVPDPEPTVAWPLSTIGSVSSYVFDSRRPSRWW